jgi:3-phenylpropionate/cinnamic acid dioxygenase small subunit
MTGMDQTSQKVADQFEITNLIARICHVADTGAVEDYALIYTDDVVWDFATSPGGATASPLAPQQGLALILDGVRARRAAGTMGPGSTCRHVVSTTIVDVDGDTAEAKTYFRIYDTTAAPTVRTMGTYVDSLRRYSVGWRIYRRQFIFA